MSKLTTGLAAAFPVYALGNAAAAYGINKLRGGGKPSAGFSPSFSDIYHPERWGNDIASLGGTVSNAWDAAKGNPDEIKKGYDSAIAAQQSGSADIRNFLAGQQEKALGYYKPLQQLFNSSFGTKGMMPAQAPGVPGSMPLTSMFGGAK